MTSSSPLLVPKSVTAFVPARFSIAAPSLPEPGLTSSASMTPYTPITADAPPPPDAGTVGVPIAPTMRRLRERQGKRLPHNGKRAGANGSDCCVANSKHAQQQGGDACDAEDRSELFHGLCLHLSEVDAHKETLSLKCGTAMKSTGVDPAGGHAHGFNVTIRDPASTAREHQHAVCRQRIPAEAGKPSQPGPRGRHWVADRRADHFFNRE